MQFNQIIEKLAKVQRAQRFALYIGCYVLLAVLYYFAGYDRAMTNKEAYISEGETLKKSMADVQAAEAEEKTLEVSMVRLQEELRELKKELPNEGEITESLRGVSDRANAVGLEVRGFARVDEVPLADVVEVPVSIEVYGGYHQVANFFDQLSKMRRIVYVQNITMASPEFVGDDVFVTVTGHAVTFRFFSDSELAEKEGGGKKKKKKGKK